MYRYYEYKRHNHIAVGIGIAWKQISFYLSLVGGFYLEIRLGKFFISWVHHGNALRKELDADRERDEKGEQ